MTTRRRIIAGATLACLYGPALAKPGDLSMPPQLSELRDLSLATPGGAATTLGRHLATGTATVVSLWATWCGPCSNEAAHLAEVRSRISTERLNIVGINVDSKPDEAKIANFLKRSGVNFTQLRVSPRRPISPSMGNYQSAFLVCTSLYHLARLQRFLAAMTEARHCEQSIKRSKLR